MRGRGSYNLLADWLVSQKPNAMRTLSESLARLPALTPGLLFLITDGLDPAAAGALRNVTSKGHELVLSRSYLQSR